MTGLFVPGGGEHCWNGESDSGNGTKKERYLQKKRDVSDKEFDPEEKDKSGCRHFLPAIWGNFRNLYVVVHKEKFIICTENREKHQVGRMPIFEGKTYTVCVYRSIGGSYTVSVSKAKVEMFHQVGVSRNHVKDVSSSGFHLTLDQDALTVWHHHT